MPGIPRLIIYESDAEVQAYSTMTRSLLVMADRLRELRVTRVVMEAASYWKPVFYSSREVGGVSASGTPGQSHRSRSQP